MTLFMYKETIDGDDGPVFSVMDPIYEEIAKTAYRWMGELAIAAFTKNPDDLISKNIALPYCEHNPFTLRNRTAFVLSKKLDMWAILRFRDDNPQTYNPYTTLILCARNEEEIFYQFTTSPYYLAWKLA